MPQKGTSRNVYTYRKREYPNLQQRRRRWYAVMAVPKDLRDRIGKTRFVKTLGTSDLGEAQKRLPAILAKWQAQVAEVRQISPEDVTAVWYQRALADASTEVQRQIIREEIERQADDIAYLNMDWRKHKRPSDVPEAQDFYKKATGSKILFTTHLEAWLAQADMKPKTKDMHRSAIMKFAKACPYISDVTHEAVQRWVSAQPVSPATSLRNLGGLRGYWRYLQRADVAAVPREVLPFDHLDLGKRRTNKSDDRLPFPPGDIPKLIKAAEDDPQLADLITLAAYTGCRRGELCALKCDDVAKDHFKITDAKTAAGIREVPIHKAINETVKRLLEQSNDGYLFSGLTETKNGRGGAIGQRFGRLKKDLGYDHRYVFHSIRKTVSTALENAGVPENVAADILGHEKPRITYGLYSGGTSLAVKAKALAKIAYPHAR